MLPIQDKRKTRFFSYARQVALLVLFVLNTQGASLPDRPNIIVILTDDQGYGDLSIHGNTLIQTPNMDRLAKEGVRVKEFYVTPLCATTRASLLTGRYNQRTGVFWPAKGAEVLRHGEVTIAEALKEVGYHTSIIGKWHLGRYGQYSPLTHGFDEFFGFRDGMIDDYFDTTLEHNGRPTQIHNYITNALTEAALRFVQTNQHQPFFLYLSYNAPHIPNQVPEKYEQVYIDQGLPSQLAKVYGMISCLDDGIGKILQTLQKLHLDERTIIFFLSDNGPQMETGREMKQFRSPEWQNLDAMWKGVERYNSNLRGDKSSVYEGGIRSPFFARWPGQFPAGRTLDMAAAHIDLLPTILELCGLKDLRKTFLDGKSLAPFLKSGKGHTLHKRLFFWSDPPSFSVNNTHGVSNLEISYPRNNWAIRSGPWKLVRGIELYHLENDPYEQTNLATFHPEIARELKNAFNLWADELWADELARGEEFFPPLIPVGPEEQTPSIMTNVFLGGTVIDIAWAQLHGPTIHYDYDKLVRDKITGWETSKAFLRWNIDVKRKGKYEVILHYGCSREDAGSRIQIKGGEDLFEFVLDPTAAMNVWETRTVGYLHLQKGQSTLEIRALSVPGKAIMDLHEIRLRWLPD